MPIGSLPPKKPPLYQLKLAVHTKGAFKTSGTIPNTGLNAAWTKAGKYFEADLIKIKVVLFKN